MSRTALLLLGNGFDIAHGLKTGPKDLFEQNKDDEINNKIELFTSFDVSYFWSEFETSLGDANVEFILENLEKSYPIDYLSDHERDRNAIIWAANTKVLSREDVVDALEKMIDKANRDLSHVNNVPDAVRLMFQKLDGYEKVKIITFNYTETLEKLYPKFDDIIHIHGDIKSSIIVGYDNDNLDIEQILNDYENGEKDPYIDQVYDEIYSKIIGLKKELKIAELTDFMNGFAVDDVYVYGHRIANVDLPYFEIIEKEYKPRWFVYNTEPEKILNKPTTEPSRFIFTKVTT